MTKQPGERRTFEVCQHCPFFEWHEELSNLGYCSSPDSEHYLHVIMERHPACSVGKIAAEMGKK